MRLQEQRTSPLIAGLILAAAVVFQGCGYAAAQRGGAGPVIPKEAKMQSSPDPDKPKKSKPPIPETLGATTAPFELGKRTTTISFEIHEPAGPARVRPEGQAKRVLLRVENVKSEVRAPTFDVYLNAGPGKEPENTPERLAFTLSTFGLVEASRSKGHHPGNGLNFLEDVTELFVGSIKNGDWNGRTLRVSFVPAEWGDYPISVQVGRVSLLVE